MNRIGYDSTDPYQAAALNAISDAIDERRRAIPEMVKVSATHPKAETCERAARNALDAAARLRRLEHAAWQLGENLDRYLPAVYRTPTIHRPS